MTDAQEAERMLAEARRLQALLKSMVHQIMAAQDSDRKQMSIRARDEVLQMLVAVSLRLQRLDSAVSAGDKVYNKELATSQKMVDECVELINKFASGGG